MLDRRHSCCHHILLLLLKLKLLLQMLLLLLLLALLHLGIQQLKINWRRNVSVERKLVAMHSTR